MTAPTTRETADHAELARLAEAAAPYWHAANLACGGNPIAVDLVAPFVGAMSPAACSALLSEIAALRGRENEMIAAHAVAVMRIERQRDELRKALGPFAALADKFGCWSVVEVCAPEPGNTSPVIQPLPLSAFETAAALIANQGADQ